MLDAKSILENIVRGAAPSQSSSGAGSGGGLSDLINEISNSLSHPRGQSPGGAQPTGLGAPGTSIGDILGDLARQFAQRSSTDGPAPSKSGSLSGGSAAPAATSNPNIGDIFAQLKDRLNQAGGTITDGGSITDMLGKIFTQATQGANEGASRIGEATGASDALARAASDPQAAQILEQLKGVLRENPFAAGATAGGLGGLVLGTRAGRSLAASAVRLGALAMIGGLAYKAMQNYQAGKPLITGSTTAPAAPPSGSGFEPAAVTNDAAQHYIEAMIAAAAADGRVDPAEHEKLISNLSQAGLGSEAEAFLAKQLNDPRSVQELAASVKSPEEAVQLYTAARIAIADNSPAETQFLASLAAALGIDSKLAAHVDATMPAAA
jgi:uncharacterized membrane protein YebE (DUF533 family)